MGEAISKILKSIKTYLDYMGQIFIEIYLHYTSPYPLYIIFKKISLAHRKLRIIWAKPRIGRKPLDQQTVDLIIELKSLNPKWGALRISNELAKIGHKVCKKTVLKYLEINGLLTPAPRNGLTWKQFLGNHKFRVGIDFTSLITLGGHQAFIFVIINIDTRELVHVNVTFNPTSEWIKQQFRDAFFDLDQFPTLCISDRDQIFAGWFKEMMMDYFETKVIQTPYRSPWKNGITERFHLSIKNEVFDNVIPINLNQTRRLCLQYQKYYNEHRTHQGINGNLPSKANPIKSSSRVKFKRQAHLEGKFTTFESEYAHAG